VSNLLKEMEFEVKKVKSIASYPKLYTEINNLLYDGTVPKDFLSTMLLAELFGLYTYANNKVRISLDTNFSINGYFFLFAKSGRGKDKTLHKIRTLFSKSYMELIRNRRKKNIAYARSIAKKKHNDETKFQSYLKEEADTVLSLSTYAGMEKQMSLSSDMNYGNILVIMNELSSFMINHKSDIKSTFTLLLQGYDLGNIKTKKRAGADFNNKDIRGLNINFLIFSSIHAFNKNEQIREDLLSEMATGLARRSFIYVDENEEELLRYSGLNEYLTAQDKMEDKYSNNFKSIQNKIAESISEIKSNYILDLNNDTKKMFAIYRDYLKLKYSSYIDDNEILGYTLVNNATKTIKLAALFTLMKNEDTVSLESFGAAMIETEKYFNHAMKLSKELKKTNIEFLVESLEAREKKIQISLHKLLKDSFVTKSDFNKTNAKQTLALMNQVSKKGTLEFVDNKLRYTPIVATKTNADNDNVISTLSIEIIDSKLNENELKKLFDGYAMEIANNVLSLKLDSPINISAVMAEIDKIIIKSIGISKYKLIEKEINEVKGNKLDFIKILKFNPPTLTPNNIAEIIAMRRPMPDMGFPQTIYLMKLYEKNKGSSNILEAIATLSSNNPKILKKLGLKLPNEMLI
jgi:hypothetical protein